jgi:hypothetical protein
MYNKSYINIITRNITQHSVSTYKVILETSQTVIVLIALVQKDERVGQSHTSESLLHQFAT